LGYALARLHGKPYFVWLHGVLATFQRQVSPGKKWLYGRLLVRRILKHASVIFFTARGECEQARPLGLLAPKAVVPTGFIAEEFAHLPPRGAFRARYLDGFDGPLVLYLGRLNAKKGLDLLASAMFQVIGRRPDVRLVIAGPPDPACFEQRVRRWIAENRIQSSTTLIGPIGPAEKLQAMADADVLIMPSYAENFGFSVFEAMASGVPVVVSETLDYAEEIGNRGAGFSVARNAADFADAAVRLIDDPVLRRRMGWNGVELANSYSWRNTGGRVERVLKALLAGQPIPPDLVQ
jgi:glycosyltransferase involved in cell wall biosynthesis